MASLTKESDRGRKGWRLRFYVDGKQKSLYLGNFNKRNAETVKRHVEELVHASGSNTKPDVETARWANGLKGRLRKTLEDCGLIEPSSATFCDADKKLGPFLDRYIAGRTDVSDATREKYGHTKRFLVGKFGADRKLDSITKADAKAWQRWLAEQPAHIDKDGNVVRTMASSTASKHVKRAKTMFAEAVDAELIQSNPMDAIKGGEEVNRSRDYFIDRLTAKKVLDACPDVQWRLVFGLARFGGLRRCEITELKWSDVQWEQSRIRIDSPKTGLRFAPIFPELRPILEEAFYLADEGDIRCVTRYSRSSNLGTSMNRIIERASLKPWEKTFQNLRASRRTELEESFPNHVVNSWMGHSARVAEKSYLQVTPAHWEAGASTETELGCHQDRGLSGGLVPARTEAFTGNGAQKNLGNTAEYNAESPGNVASAPPTGLLRRRKSRCFLN